MPSVLGLLEAREKRVREEIAGLREDTAVGQHLCQSLDHRLRICLRLRRVQLGIRATRREELGVGAVFGEAAVVDDGDAVGHVNGGEAVRNQDGDRAGGAGRSAGVGDELFEEFVLGLRVQG